MILAGFSLYSRWVTAEQARLLYLFGQQMKEVETNLRSAYLLPLHDISPERQKIRDQIKNIESEMQRHGRIAEGPGHYTLRDYETARTHLEQAWQRGYRPPEVAYALWQVMSGLYEKKLAQTSEIGDKELREGQSTEIEKQYLHPALDYLKVSGVVQLEASDYKEALTAFYKDAYDEALKKAEEVFAKATTLYEAKNLQGDIYSSKWREKMRIGDYQRAFEDYERAGEAYRLAMEMARSDLAVYEAELMSGHIC